VRARSLPPVGPSLRAHKAPGADVRAPLGAAGPQCRRSRAALPPRPGKRSQRPAQRSPAQPGARPVHVPAGPANLCHPHCPSPGSPSARCPRPSRPSPAMGKRARWPRATATATVTVSRSRQGGARPAEGPALPPAQVAFLRHLGDLVHTPRGWGKEGGRGRGAAQVSGSPRCAGLRVPPPAAPRPHPRVRSARAGELGPQRGCRDSRRRVPGCELLLYFKGLLISWDDLLSPGPTLSRPGVIPFSLNPQETDTRFPKPGVVRELTSEP
jgi:hypothetical protein